MPDSVWRRPSVRQACKNLRRKQNLFRPFSVTPVNKGFRPGADALMAPAGPSAASATSALTGFDFDLGFSPRLRASAVNILFVLEAMYAY